MHVGEAVPLEWERRGLRVKEPSEEELARLALEGRRDAWDALVARHGRQVLLVLLARGVRVDRAKDIVQETWARLLAHQQAGRLDRLELPGLAIRQAIFFALEDARRDRRATGDDELAILTDPAPSAETRIHARAQLDRARVALERCPKQARRIFELTYADVPHAETARQVGLSVQRVRQTLCEVRARLRAAIEEENLFTFTSTTEHRHD